MCRGWMHCGGWGVWRRSPSFTGSSPEPTSIGRPAAPERITCESNGLPPQASAAGYDPPVRVAAGWRVRVARGPRSGAVILNPSVYPVSFAPCSTDEPGASAYLADPGVRRLAEFFEQKGLAKLKEE